MKRGRRVESVLRTLSVVCFVAGGLLLVWPPVRIVVTGYEVGRNQSAALAAWEEESGGPRAFRGGTLVLEIPRLGLRRFVPDGATVVHLKEYGVGHISWTAFPPPPAHPGARPAADAGRGDGEVVAIAGHRTTYGAPFFRIGELRPGDAIILRYGGRRYAYDVDRQITVRPDDTRVLDGDADHVALVTCTPPGSAAFRLIVLGHLDHVSAAPESARLSR